jgi:RNA polymerase sigma-B factor
MIGTDDSQLDEVDARLALPPLLATLPVREQRILAMRFFGNLTQSQIAAEMGISQMHVSRLITRALETLRHALLED